MKTLELKNEPPRGKTNNVFPNRSDTNQAVQLQKQARSLKFWSYVEEELYYPSSENKGADQLRGYREADLRLCFRLCRLLVFPWGGSIDNSVVVKVWFFIHSNYRIRSNYRTVR